jgi:hypothetical protein
VKGVKGASRARQLLGGQLSGTAAPEALAGAAGRSDDTTRLVLVGFPVAHLRGGSGERRGRHAVTKLPEVNAKHPETDHNGIRPAPSEQNFRVL